MATQRNLGEKHASKQAGKSSAWRRVTRVQLAQLLGVHQDTVTDYARQGMPVIAAGGRGKESVYDAVECLDWWRERQGKNAKEAAQTRLYSENADIAALKRSTMAKELFPREQLVREGQAFVRAWMAMVRRIPRRFVNAGLVPREREGDAAGLIRDVLDEASRWKTQADLKRVLKHVGQS